MLLALLMVLATSPPADAKATAVVSGVVTDVLGAVVPGTKLIFSNDRTKEKVVVTTSADGRYEVKMAPGVYSISTHKPPFNIFRREGVRLTRGEIRIIDVMLKAGTSCPEPIPVDVGLEPLPNHLEEIKSDR